MATFVCIKQSGMYSVRFNKLARQVFKMISANTMVKIGRSASGETCLYKIAWIRDVDYERTMAHMRSSLMQQIAQSLKLKFNYVPWAKSDFPAFSPDLVDTTGFRKSCQEVFLNGQSFIYKADFQLREVMLVHDMLFGDVIEAEYDKSFLDEMHGAAKSGKALAKATLIAEERARLHRLKDMKYAEIDSWFSSELQKLNDIRSSKRHAVTSRYSKQLNDIRQCLDI